MTGDASPSPALPKERRSQSEWQELRLQSLSLVLWGTCALAILVVVVPDPRLDTADFGPSGNVALCLLASVLLAGVVRRATSTLAAAALLIGLGGSLLVAARFFGAEHAVPWFALLAFTGTLLLGQWGGLATAIAATTLLAALPVLGLPATAASVRDAQLLVWAAFALSALTTWSLRTALDWSWHNYEYALAKTQELEHHQGELTRALKGLNEACYRLEVVNLELARSRQAAHQARQLKERFAAFVSHELRLPLNIITGFSEMMVMSPGASDGQALPADYRSGVEAIYRAAYHLSSLVEDVLELSEIDAHRMGLHKEQSSLEEIMAQASAAVSGLFQNKGLWLKIEAPPNLPPVFADRTRIRQVIMNLLKNAARFTDSGGVTLSASSRDNEVVVAVADTGIGIAPDDVPHVFEEFWQAEFASRRRSGGTGLGLAISKQFVEMHGGSMWLESRMGDGSAFSFSLPRCDNVVASARAPWETWVRTETLAGAQAGPVVAAVGSDRQAIRLLQRHLDGYRVMVAADLEALRRISAEESPQAVIIAQARGQEDPRLPERVISELPEVPVIACSVGTSRSTADSLGVADYLLKPVDRERLSGALAVLGEVGRVVVVDDDPDMAHLLTTMVRSLSPHHLVWPALDGEEALAIIEERRPEVVLLDLMMPGMSGREVLRRLRARPDLRTIPVIVVTAGELSEQGVTAELQMITRRDGLTSGQFVRCLRGALDGLLAPSDTAQA